MKLEKFIIEQSLTVHEAIEKIEDNKKGFLVVIDKEKRVVGTLTDGDIRRSIIRGSALTERVHTVCNKNFIKAFVSNRLEEIVDLFKNEKIRFLPIVDERNVLRNIITKKSLHVVLLQYGDFDLEYDFLSVDEGILEREIHARPWGYYKTTFINQYSQSKIIHVSPKGELSLQEHKRREEYWVVINGFGEVIIGESKKKIEAGSFVYIPKGCKHKLVNISEKQPLVIAEVQLGDYFGEDDIIRYEDKYGRV
jgi:mannose-1-phosphate guanylyltransferase/mannose-6-phosphate isomerase